MSRRGATARAYWAFRRAREAVRLEKRVIGGKVVDVKVYPLVFKEPEPLRIEFDEPDDDELDRLRQRWRFRGWGSDV